MIVNRKAARQVTRATFVAALVVTYTQFAAAQLAPVEEPSSAPPAMPPATAPSSAGSVTQVPAPSNGPLPAQSTSAPAIPPPAVVQPMQPAPLPPTAPAAAAPVEQPSEAVGAAKSASDHDSVVHRIGFGWYGTRNVPMPSDGGSDGIPTPLVGIRYWVNSLVGLDFAAGTMLTSGETKSKANGATSSTYDTTASSLMLHAGVPLSFFHSEHHSIELIPQFEFGYAEGTMKPPSPNTANVLKRTGTGLLVQGGVAVGAEVHFGFMGLPHLALDASLGVFFSHEYSKGEVGTASQEHTRFLLSTSNVNNPWDFFRSNIGARYYF